MTNYANSALIRLAQMYIDRSTDLATLDIQIDESSWKALQQIAEEHEVSLDAVVTAGLLTYLEYERAKKPTEGLEPPTH